MVRSEPTNKGRGPFQPWQVWLAVLVAAAAGAAVGVAVGQLMQRPRPVAMNARIDMVDAAMMYAERKSETVHRRLTTLEQWVRMILACIRHSCAPEAREVALQQAEQALDDLDATVDHFVHPYAGLFPPASDEKSSNSGDRIRN